MKQSAITLSYGILQKHDSFYTKVLHVPLLHPSQQGFKDEFMVQEDRDMRYHRERDCFLFCSASLGGGQSERGRAIGGATGRHENQCLNYLSICSSRTHRSEGDKFK